jgi:hypothetical protein
VVNPWNAWSQGYKLRERVTFPVYQEGFFSRIWKALHGRKDDILVYDRCGFLTYHLRMPYSFLTYPYVESAILVTYYRDDPCNCTLGKSPATTVAPPTEANNKTVESNDTLNSESDVEGFNVTSNSSNEFEVGGNITATSIPSASSDPLHGNATEVEPKNQTDQHRQHEEEHEKKK